MDTVIVELGIVRDIRVAVFNPKSWYLPFNLGIVNISIFLFVDIEIVKVWEDIKARLIIILAYDILNKDLVSDKHVRDPTQKCVFRVEDCKEYLSIDMTFPNTVTPPIKLNFLS